MVPQPSTALTLDSAYLSVERKPHHPSYLDPFQYTSPPTDGDIRLEIIASFGEARKGEFELPPRMQYPTPKSLPAPTKKRWCARNAYAHAAAIMSMPLLSGKRRFVFLGRKVGRDELAAIIVTLSVGEAYNRKHISTRNQEVEGRQAVRNDFRALLTSGPKLTKDEGIKRHIISGEQPEYPPWLNSFIGLPDGLDLREELPQTTIDDWYRTFDLENQATQEAKTFLYFLRSIGAEFQAPVIGHTASESSSSGPDDTLLTPPNTPPEPSAGRLSPISVSPPVVLKINLPAAKLRNKRPHDAVSPANSSEPVGRYPEGGETPKRPKYWDSRNSTSEAARG